MDSQPEYHEVSNIQYISSIQSFACIIAVQYIPDENQFRVVGFSENLFEKSWHSISLETEHNLIGNTLDVIFDASTAKTLYLQLLRYHINLQYAKKALGRNEFQTRQLSRNAYMVLGESTVCWSIVDSSDNSIYVIEFEEINDLEPTLRLKLQEYYSTCDISSQISNQTNSLENLLEQFLTFVLSVVPRYDRGMVYRFSDDGDVEVVCEQFVSPDIKSSYKGCRFPAEDIPTAARKMYIANVVRYIYDVDSQDSPLIYLPNQKIDLSMCTSRAVSECHKTYIRNMGVKSSLSVAIVVDEDLWGLFNLHAYDTCVRPTPEERNVLEMCGITVSAEIRKLLADIVQQKKLQINKLLNAIQGFPCAKEFMLAYSHQILEIVDADALVMYEDGGVVVMGDEALAPTEDGIAELFRISNYNVPLAITDFSKVLNNNGAGVLFYKDQSLCFLFVRRSKYEDVRWGRKADPRKFSDTSERLHPIGSFEAYLEEAKKECRPWSKTDIELAQAFFDQVVHHLHGESIATLRQSLDHSNEECVKAAATAKEHDEFFAHMSHELRTPFHGVMSSVQILKANHTKMSPKERGELINSALECGKVMLQTLDDILTIAKSKNVVEIVKKPFKLCHTFDTSYKIMMPIAELKSILLLEEFGTLQTCSSIHTISRFRKLVARGDATRLEQICNNLVNNALKFTNTGGTVIKRIHLVPSLEDALKVWNKCRGNYDCSYMCVTSPLEGVALDPSYSWLVNEVQDTGCGVDAQLLPVMFDPYRQVDSYQSTAKLYQGTGLGLHICRLHVELMKGFIGVSSSVGKGTTVVWSVPLQIMEDTIIPSPKQSDSESPLQFERSSHGEGEVQPIQNKDNIFLVVDDSTVNLRLAKKKLQLIVGHEANIITANNGLEAVTVYQDTMLEGKQHLIKCILMDYHMPVCSGPEAIEEIRSIEREHNLPPAYIIAFTADMSENSQKDLTQAGANQVMPKPTPSGQLERTIRDLLK